MAALRNPCSLTVTKTEWVVQIHKCLIQNFCYHTFSQSDIRQRGGDVMLREFHHCGWQELTCSSYLEKAQQHSCLFLWAPFQTVPARVIRTNTTLTACQSSEQRNAPSSWAKPAPGSPTRRPLDISVIGRDTPCISVCYREGHLKLRSNLPLSVAFKMAFAVHFVLFFFSPKLEHMIDKQ